MQSLIGLGLSEEDLVLLGLDEVVNASGPLVPGILHANVHKASCLEIVKVFHEAHVEVVEACWLKARVARVPHELDKVLDLGCVLPHRQEPLLNF